jgi:monoamine oxidase
VDHEPGALRLAEAPESPAPPRDPVLSRRAFLAHAGTALAAPALAACGRAGSRRAPPGERTRVVVIGAGLAGLAAAHELTRAGVEVRVLEARSRPGGRVHTLRDPFDDGLHAEAGAVFVPGDHAQTLRFCREFGVALRPEMEGRGGAGSRLFVGGASVRVRPGERTAWPLPLKHREMGLTPGELRSVYLAPVVDAIGDPEHPLWPGDAALRYDAVTMGQLLRHRGASPGAVALMRLGYLDEWGDGIDAVSALGLMRDLAASRGGAGSFRIVGGSDRLPAAMAARLGSAIRYGAAATAIEQGRRGVRVRYAADGRERTVGADRVVCAIPFTLLRRMSVHPPLSAPKQAAVAQLPATSVTRVYLQVRERFWDAADGDAVATDLPIMLAAHATAGQEGTRGILEAFVTGASARELARLPAVECVRRVREQMGRVHPGLNARVERAAVFAWDRDPWARGDYVWFRPGQVRALAPHLATAEGRVHFAGDHTSTRPGWMQGALDSGLRAAAEVLEALGGTGVERKREVATRAA